MFMVTKQLLATSNPGVEMVKETVHRVNDDPIPRFDTLRRVPERYRGLLPLGVMKKYQCVVISSTRGSLTVAISEQQDLSVLEFLSKLSGCTIFPVLATPFRMRLLIRRIERTRHIMRHRDKFCWHMPSLHPLQVHAIVMLITDQWKKLN
jgi:Type II secretion system (T2SS), protein E, N-terminal domain